MRTRVLTSRPTVPYARRRAFFQIPSPVPQAVTSSFGVSRRESHDASGFYDRFTAPVISPDKVLGTRRHPVDVLVAGDARAMDQVDDATVALVVTSPPYLSA